MIGPVIVPPVVGRYVPLSALTALVVKAVVAIWVVLVPPVAVGAVGVPVSAGLFSGALLVTVELLEMILSTLLELVNVVALLLPLLVTSPVRAGMVVTVLAEVADVAVAALPLILPVIVELNVLVPAIFWLLLRSTKFWVIEPVPPWLTGRALLR